MNGGNMETNQELILGVVNMARKLAWSFYKTTGEDVEDLFSEAMIAVTKASQTFDPAKGTKFTTYATRCIKWTLINWVNGCGKRSQNKAEFLEENKSEPANRIQEMRVEFRDALEILSEDASYVKDLLLDPEAFLGKPSKGVHYVRKEVERFLIRQGWTQGRVQSACIGIKIFLNQNR